MLKIPSPPEGHQRRLYLHKNQKSMPGLKQAALLAYDHLKASLSPYGYNPILGTIGMWKHESRPTIFCLCVDDFGAKYWSKEDADHLCNAIGMTYKYAVDREGQNYYGLSLDWNYVLGYVDISMPKYMPDTLKKLIHTPNISPQYAPHKHNSIHYSQQ